MSIYDCGLRFNNNLNIEIAKTILRLRRDLLCFVGIIYGMRDLYETFINDAPHLKESEKDKKIRQARIRSYASSARHRKRHKSKATPFKPHAIIRTRNQPDENSAVIVHDYRNQQKHGVKRRQLEGETSYTNTNPTTAKVAEAPMNEIRPSSVCGIPNADVMAGAFPAQAYPRPPLLVPSSFVASESLESRAMRFFIERTAVEWTGWLDEPIWRHIAPQMSVSQPALKHALISLALYHEHLETQDHDSRIKLWHLSFSHGRKALGLLVEQYDDMPVSVIIVLYFVVTMVTSLLDRETGYQALQAHYALLDRTLLSLGYTNKTEIALSGQDVTHYLLHILRRRKEKHGRVVDVLWSLVNAPIHCFAAEQTVSIPNKFTSLSHARYVLEVLLKDTTYRAKIRGCHDCAQTSEARSYLYVWLEALQAYASRHTTCDDEIHAAAVLRVCGKIGYMLIEMMYETDEMAFDNYVGLFRELAIVFEQNTAHRTRGNKTNMCFYLDASFNTYVAQAAIRWCRDPSIRQRLINSLAYSRRYEGVESTRSWASLARHVKMIEEYGIVPPPLVCSDIPAERRVRCISYQIFWEHVVTHVRYVQPPWQEDHVQDLWICQRNHIYSAPPGVALGSHPPQWLLNAKPDQIWERGRVSWRMKGTDQHYILEDLDFHFPLPRA